MHVRICRVGDLIDKEYAFPALITLVQRLAGLDEVAVGLRKNFCQLRVIAELDGLPAKSPDDLEALLTDLVLNIDAEMVAFSCRNRCQTNARVATRRLDDGVTRMQQSPLLRVLNHRVGDAVLDALVRIEIFQLDDHLGQQVLLPLVICELQKRRMPDEFRNRMMNSHENLPFCCSCFTDKNCYDPDHLPVAKTQP